MLAKAFDIPAERIERADADAALKGLLNSETAYLFHKYAFHRRIAWPLVPLRV